MAEATNMNTNASSLFTVTGKMIVSDHYPQEIPSQENSSILLPKHDQTEVPDVSLLIALSRDGSKVCRVIQ